MSLTSLPAGRDGYYARVYSPTFLTRIYDYYVLGFNMRWVWGCPTDSVLLPFFKENMSRRHLDIGVATGYFPARALSSLWRVNSSHQVTLLDITASSLSAAKSRILSVTGAADVTCVEADVTEPLPKALEHGEKFESISMFNLFHCVPGDKLGAFGTYAALLEDHGVLSGCTILGETHATGWFSRWYVRMYNRKGIFNNLHDEEREFVKALEEAFEEVETWLVGMMLMFRARRPRRACADLLQ